MGKVNDLFVQASVEIVRKLLRNINKHGFKFQILNPNVCLLKLWNTVIQILKKDILRFFETQSKSFGKALKWKYIQIFLAFVFVSTFL